MDLRRSFGSTLRAATHRARPTSHLPEEVHNELVRRAEVAGQSLQQYLSAQLASLAATPTIDDVYLRTLAGRARGEPGVSGLAERLAAQLPEGDPRRDRVLALSG